MEHFSFKGGCGICERTCIKALKEEWVWAIDKWLQLIINKILFKTVMLHKVIFNLKQYCMCCYIRDP